jgi:hypothetical protein
MLPLVQSKGGDSMTAMFEFVRGLLVLVGSLSLFFLVRDWFEIALSDAFQAVRAVYAVFYPAMDALRQLLSDLFGFELPLWLRDAFTLSVSLVGNVAWYRNHEKRVQEDGSVSVRSEIGISIAVKATVAGAAALALLNAVLLWLKT